MGMGPGRLSWPSGSSFIARGRGLSHDEALA